MNIGEAAKAAGVSAKMIRHYESIGLLPRAVRSDAGYRRYTESDLGMLAFVRRARAAGFSLAETRRLLDLWRDRDRTAREVRTLAGAHLETIRARIAGLEAVAKTLEHLVGHCRGDERPECPILDALAGEPDRRPAVRSRTRR